MPHVIDSITCEGLNDIKSLRAQAVVQATAASTYTLAVASEASLIFTGTTAGQIVRLGDATTYSVGHIYIIHNNSTQSVTVQNNATTTLFTLGASQRTIIVLQNNTTAAGIWVYTLTATSAGGTGTVTSVGLAAPVEFTVSGSPVTSTGTLTLTKATQTANTAWLGPTSGAAAVPTFRALVKADWPELFPSNPSGLTVAYNAGTVQIGGTYFAISASSVTVGANITGGWVYVNSSGVVTSGASLPTTGVVPIAQFTSGAATISSLTDTRTLLNSVPTTITGSGLQIKSGTVTAGTFTGNPKTATVTFGTAFSSTSYSITLTGLDDRNLSWESKAAGSFVINTNSNVALTGNVDWQCIVLGESN